jgi:hypothetical protein
MSFTQSTSGRTQTIELRSQQLQQQQQNSGPLSASQPQPRTLAPHPPFTTPQQELQWPLHPHGQTSLQQPITQQPVAQLQTNELRAPIQQQVDFHEQEEETAVRSRIGPNTFGLMIDNSQGEKTKKVRNVCQGFAPRSKNYDTNTITLLDGMIRYPPFVKHGLKKEAWEKVALYVRSNGGKDLQKANYNLCMKRYEALRDEFKKQEAESRRASGVAETMTQKEALLQELVQKEDDFNQHSQQQNQEAEDDFSAQTYDEFHGHINRQESLRQMMATGDHLESSSSSSQASTASLDPSSASSSASASTQSPTTATTSTNRLASAESTRFNPIGRRAPRKQVPRSSTVEKRMLELMENINGLVTDIRKKIS